MSGTLVAAWRRRMDAWIDRRNPVQRQLSLDHQRIFIFPARTGLGFLILLALMLLLAINYQNNLIFILCFWLFSLLLITIMHSYRNVAGLQLRAGAAEPVFAGQTAVFKLYLDGGGRLRESLHLGFVGQEDVTVSLPAADAPQSCEVQLHTVAGRRGRFSPGRLQISGYFPLGLLRCWSLVRLDWHCIVYPAPKALRPLPLSAGGEGDSGEDLRGESEEFSGFKTYRPGDPPRRIHWKALAKGQGLISRYFEAQQSQELVLDWFSLEGLGGEEKLSTLCAWALQCDQRGLLYGLRLPGQEIASGSGEAHLERVLTVLALVAA
ncbi:DUF58 domain-containing protein [Spongiibacter taiwanensis]|uniref:DUF58 domain-containing protein n=1 Tax=Spongiibacter taiwanensis TaxID=1748242 RepID=UPI0020362AB2|nr:DUF58 domain-containing protein [Spongiibacter taiwanensis]USA43204.1 DUF58 domain-containing protein [Spongiibacter taiwanensis]